MYPRVLCIQAHAHVHLLEIQVFSCTENTSRAGFGVDRALHARVLGSSGQLDGQTNNTRDETVRALGPRLADP